MSRTNTAKTLENRKKREKKFLTDLKFRKLRQVNRRGQITGQKKKMSTFKAQSSYDIAKQQSGSKTGMSNLGAGYKKAEEKLSETATKKSARISKARFPKMGTYKGKGKTTDTKTSTTTAKRGKSSIEAKNRARLGDARVDKLKAKNKDFQAMKKGKMTKAQFIKKYPNSQTAKKARMK